MKCLLILLFFFVIVSGAGRNEKIDPCLEEFGVTGPCRARIPRWGRNNVTGACEKFFYGGCHGNGNNFPSRSKCRKMCKA
ncbi:hypothetical protein RB195_021380 [Necator americanus]|uniref:BPTI/Kunitz inhibitor domain-containing protein n=1 Tax=Necator americanus TaxID=51031 RepID=A0ABR1EAR8_NECAM